MIIRQERWAGDFRDFAPLQDIEDSAKGFHHDSHLLLTVLITVESIGCFQETEAGLEGLPHPGLLICYSPCLCTFGCLY